MVIGVKVLRVGGREVLRVRVDLSELNEVLTPAFVPSTILKNILEHYRSTFTLLGIAFNSFFVDTKGTGM